MIHYARILDWATSGPGRLPDISPLERIFKLPRPPPIPEHCFAEDALGEERCVFCLLPPALARGRHCRRIGTRRHKIFRLGSGIFCGRCGAHSFEQVVLLSSECLGRPTSAGNEWRLKRMLDGKRPKTGMFIGTPSLIDPALATFAVVLGEDPANAVALVQAGPSAVVSVQGRPGPHRAT